MIRSPPSVLKAISALSSLPARFQSTLQGLDEARWHSAIWYDATGNPQPQHHQHTTIVHHQAHSHHAPNVGKPLALLMMEDENILLDPDSLATLLLFLFVEDQKMNSMRLHRVIRNLCHHEPTRDWVISALISIVQKTNEENGHFGAGKAGSKPEWLKLRVDAAFGYKSNIFLINRQQHEGSTSSSSSSISINPQAAQMIVRNCLDMLFVLAKHYPGSFVPFNRETVKARRFMSSLYSNSDPVPPGGTLDFRSRFCRYQVANRLRGMLDDPPPVKTTPLDESPSTSKAAAAKAAATAGSSSSKVPPSHTSSAGGSGSIPYQTNAKNFWDVVMNIDRQTEVRLAHVTDFPLTSQPAWEWQPNNTEFLSFSDSPFGQLLEMLPYKVICRSPHLTDMLVKLLASLSTELPKEEEQLPFMDQMPTLIPIGQATGAPPSGGAVGALSAAAAAVAAANAASGSESGDSPTAASGGPNGPAGGNPGSGDSVSATAPPTKPPQLPTLSVALPVAPMKSRRKIYAKNFSQLQLVIEVLTHQCGTTEGLDNVAKLIVNLTQCSQASNAIFIQYLTAAILGLAEEVRQAIQTLLEEIRAYNSNVQGGAASTSKAAAAASAVSGSASSAPSGSSSGASTGASLLTNLTVHEGIMQDRFTAEHVVISAPKNAKPTCELQLPSMKKLMSNSSAQPYFLRTLKIFMQVRDMYEAQNAGLAGAGAGAGAGPGSSSSSGAGSGGGGIPGGLASGDMDDDIIDIEGDGGASGGSSSDATATPAPTSMETNQSSHDTLDDDEDDDDDDDDEDEIDILVPDDPRSLRARRRAAAAAAGAGAGAVSFAAGNPSKPTLSQILCLDVLWHTLSECLVALEESKDEFAVLVLQPTVEAFFLIHASHRVAAKKSGRSGISGVAAATLRALGGGLAGMVNPPSSVQQHSPLIDESSSGNTLSSASFEGMSFPRDLPLPSNPNNFSNPPPDEPRMQDAATNTPNSSGGGATVSAHEAQLRQDRQKFLQFAEKHRTVLNQILRQSLTHLSDGPFAVLVDHTRILDFDVKRKYFQTELERLDEGIRREEHTVSVRRVTVFEDSFRVLYRLGPEEWKNRFYIVFEGEF